MCRVEVLLLLCSIALTKCIALNIDVPVRQIIDDGENNNCGLVLTDRYSYLLPTYGLYSKDIKFFKEFC